MHHPEPWEVVFSSDVSDRPPTMTWRYPEPRALSAVDLVPLPLSTPVLVNTLNMGEEYQVRVSCCVLLVRKFLACPQIVLLLSHSLCRHATLLGALRDDTKRGCKANLRSAVFFFFFQAKGEKKRTHSFSPRLQTKREEGPPDRRLLQIRVVQRRFNFRQFDSARDRER